MGQAARRWRGEPLPRPAAQPGAPVLGFRQPVAALTHVATGPASQGRNSINKTRPLDNVHRVRAETPRERVHHLFPPLPPPHHPPVPVTCQPPPLMSNILGYHSYGLNSAPLPLRNEAVTQLVFAFQHPTPHPRCACLPACKLACICPHRGGGAGHVCREAVVAFQVM